MYQKRRKHTWSVQLSANLLDVGDVGSKYWLLLVKSVQVRNLTLEKQRSYIHLKSSYATVLGGEAASKSGWEPEGCRDIMILPLTPECMFQNHQINKKRKRERDKL